MTAARRFAIPSGQVRGVVLVFRDFSEHKEHEQKLKEARDAAESANKAKDQFLAMLSHELRTPLTPVLATLNLWEASDELSPALHADAQMLRRSVELEARIIDDLLDLTRIAKGMLTFSPEETDVHEMIEYLVGMCHSEFRGKALDLSIPLRCAAASCLHRCRPFQQVLWNMHQERREIYRERRQSLHLHRERRQAEHRHQHCRHRHRHGPGNIVAPVYSIRAGRTIHQPALRRARAGDGDFLRARRTTWRNSARIQRRAWERFHLHRHFPGQAGSRNQTQETAERSMAGCVPASA